MDELNFAGKKVLVTGGEGFIGSHLVERLLELRAEVRPFALYNFRGDPGWLGSIKGKPEIYWGDVKDYNAVHEAMKDIDIVFNLAASISIPYSVLRPREVAETNILGGLNVLMAAKESGVKKVVQMSTSETFGNPEYVPMDEKHPKNPQSPYAASKASVDLLCKSFYHAYNLPVIIIRPFNTFGPRQSPRAIIASLILQFLQGDKIKVGNLDSTRDFTYVKDTVNGVLLASMVKGIDGEEINLGVGKDTSIGDLVKLVAKAAGKEKYELVQEEFRKRPKSFEIVKLRSDNSKAKKLLKWEPKYTLEQGLKESVEWFRKNKDEYKSLYYP